MNPEASSPLPGAGVAVELCRLQNGEFPAKAEDVLGERPPRVPADPPDGRPLRFRPDGMDLVLDGVDGSMTAAW